MKLKIMREDKEVNFPAYAYEHDVGMDLYSAESFVLKPGKRRVVSTGIRIALEKGYEAQIRPRSGLAAKNGISVVNSPGTIDSGYRGVIGIILINHGDENFLVKKNMRIAQMVINKVEIPEIEEVDDLDDTARGEGGFGSSGTQ